MPVAGVLGPGIGRTDSGLRVSPGWMLPNTSRNTASKAPRSSLAVDQVSLAAQYSSDVVCGTRCCSACTKVAWPLADTATPLLRRRATSAAANAAKSTPRNSNGVVMRRLASAAQ